MAERGRVRVERGAKRVRALLGGEVVADTIRPLLVWEKPYYPTYYIPGEDVAEGVLHATGETRHSPSRGAATIYTVEAGGVEAEGGAYAHLDSPIDEIRGHVVLVWSAMDHWFEEDEEVIVHPRDPYTRIDILPSSRHVRIDLDGVTLAESHRPTLLFETGLPTRFYLPMTDVRMDVLRPSDRVTRCPYKGEARHYSAHLDEQEHEHIAWSYPFPLPESVRIAGLMAFYDERVDVYVDGVLQERPATTFG